MCGIVGAVVRAGSREFLLRGLSALEYRGYDSAGIAFSDANEIRRIASAGRVAALRELAKDSDCNVGIGHTRWATHGAPTEQNAHPVVAGNVAIVHNGIIENHSALRAKLESAGRIFRTGTDTEVVAHLLDAALSRGGGLLSAMRKTVAKLEGEFAVAAIAANKSEIVFVRRGAPLMIGIGEDGAYIASDAQALDGVATRIAYLEDGDCGRLWGGGEMQIQNARGAKTERRWHSPPAGTSVAALGEYRHFMQKEIFEQPFVIAAAARPFSDKSEISSQTFGKGAANAFRRAKNIVIAACGTSHHAGMIASYWMRALGVPCRAEIASEYRYSPDAQAADSLTIAVSQSGETADTLAALRAAKKAGGATLSFVNAPASAMARESDFVLPTCAGPEIGVASTKCFTAQLAQLLALSAAIAKAKRTLSAKQETEILSQLRALPQKIRRALQLEDAIREWARAFSAAKSALYVGRRAHYPLALEGALKLKEVSYLHAEGCAAGELKHGTLALVDDAMPVVGLSPANALAAKTESNLAEIAARGGRLFVLGDAAPAGANRIPVEDGGEWISPIVFAAPLQLLAYHTALEKGTDIDKPRNLAKSVTVE